MLQLVNPIPCVRSTGKPLFCALLLLLSILSILTFFYASSTGYNHSTQTIFTYRNVFLSHSSNNTISVHLRALTRNPHLAGTTQSSGAENYVFSHLKSLRLETHTVEYKTLLSYPVHAYLSARFDNESTFEFSLVEGFRDLGAGIVEPYHAYSPSGRVVSKVVYVNHGRFEDYRVAEELGVNVRGCVVLARKGGSLSRREVVSVAESEGAAAVLLYSDGIKGGIERGTVMRGVGDPLSPGWAAVEDGERLGMEDSQVSQKFPKIPSFPISVENAGILLESLGGPLVPNEWINAGSIGVGPGPTVVNFTYQGKKKIVAIHNIIAVIRGSIDPERYVILGNHRDAWTYGAVDPNSGTAALLDVARRYALLLEKGWNPRRTIILCSWDAEEFGMVGSTEWVEQKLINLGMKAVAYINVDCAVQGPGFFAAATPQLDNLLVEVMKKVKDPESEHASVYDKWAAKKKHFDFLRLGGMDSDFSPFLHHAGVPSVDLYYGSEFPAYHTMFDSYEWMANYLDPFFHRHVAVASVWGLLGLHLADDPVLPFNYESYANELQVHADVLNNMLDHNVSLLHPLISSIRRLASAAKKTEHQAKMLKEQQWQMREEDCGSEVRALKMRSLNDRFILAERGFLDEGGLLGRKWFKHIVYGPHSVNGTKLDIFPGIADAISGSASLNRKVKHEIWRVARAIERAASALDGCLV